MNRLKHILSRLKGRIKKMAVWWMTFGAMLIPIAFMVRIEEGEPSFIVYTLLVLGFIGMAMGWIYTWREMKQNMKERRFFASLLSSMKDIQSDILRELRGDKNDNRDNK